MRENKFRGLCIYGCKWAYGDLLQGRDYPLIFDKNKEQYEVQVITVGQYIGKQDRDGTDIYEGDILEISIDGGENLKVAILDIRSLGVYNIKFKHAKIIGNIHEKKIIMEDCMENLKVGDRVEIINKGAGYFQYIEQAKSMGAKDWIDGERAINGETGHIVKIAPHLRSPYHNPSIALVRLEDRRAEILIGINGLKKIEEEFKEGDPVEIIKLPKCHFRGRCKSCYIGKKGILRKKYSDTNALCFQNKENEGWCSTLTTEYLKKIPNTTPKYDESTTKAIIDSIIHHEDNLHKLKTLKGKFISDCGVKYFLIGEKIISYQAVDCALCFNFGGEKNLDCQKCPLKIANQKCDKEGSAWKKIQQANTKEEAITAEENMVKVLKSLLEGYKIEEKHLDVLDCKVKEEVKVDKYDELRARIDKVTCWDEEADNIMQEITHYRHPYWLSICCHNGIGSAILVKDIHCKDGFENKASFTYENQCQKLSAFKQALVYLLDHSDIKKKIIDDNKKSETKIYKCPKCNKIMIKTSWEIFPIDPISQVGYENPIQVNVTINYSYGCTCGVKIVDRKIIHYYPEEKEE